MVNGSIVSEIRGHILICDNQKIQDAINGCTPLVFNIYSFEASQQLVMLPKLKKDSIYTGSERSIKINFLECINCPIGFNKLKMMQKSAIVSVI